MYCTVCYGERALGEGLSKQRLSHWGHEYCKHNISSLRALHGSLGACWTAGSCFISGCLERGGCPERGAPSSRKSSRLYRGDMTLHSTPVVLGACAGSGPRVHWLPMSGLVGCSYAFLKLYSSRNIWVGRCCGKNVWWGKDVRLHLVGFYPL